MGDELKVATDRSSPNEKRAAKAALFTHHGYIDDHHQTTQTMRKFSQFILEQSDVNTHLEHLEDLILNDGLAGASRAVEFLKTFGHTLAGHGNQKLNMTVKWDGAPAVFAGIDPKDGKFFVATKGVFNKSPILYKSQAEIPHEKGDLAHKLSLALEHLPKLGITGVVQGDFLFSDNTLRKADIDGESYLTFHPNTIVYAIPAKSVLARQMASAKIGIIWHTVYDGPSLDQMKARAGGSFAKSMKQTKDVWFDDATIKDASGTVTMTKQETDQFSALLTGCEKSLQKVSATALQKLLSATETSALLKMFNNTLVRSGQKITDPTAHVNDAVDWIVARFNAEREKLKTEKGKEGVEQKKVAALAFFANHRQDLVDIFTFIASVITAKEFAISKLNAIQHTKTFVLTPNGYQVTKHEGFVISDHLGKNTVKLVDRLEFSKANFSKEVIKGFQR